MSKYDFGYFLEAGSTNEWAFNNIDSEKNVLEIGPAIGNLTYHLKTEKNCAVDIVEIDEDAGKKASEFSRTALLGLELGNLNSDLWFNALKNNRYDYIVSLDVLEHLNDPESTLKRLKSLLKDDGHILLSVPNIAHNSVMVGLLQNRFEYTDIGLLDSTHVHFFAEESLKEMISNVELNVARFDAILKTPSETEQVFDYSNLNSVYQGLLRNRKSAEIYQFLVDVVKKPVDTVYSENFICGIKDESKYVTKALINGESKYTIERKGQLGHICFEVNIPEGVKAESVRLVPLEQAGVIKNLNAQAVAIDGVKMPLTYNWTSGQEITTGNILVKKGSDEVNYLIQNEVSKVEFEFDVSLGDESSIDVSMNGLAQLRNEKEQTELAFYKKKDECDDLFYKKKDIEEQYQILQNQNKELLVHLEELERIKSKFVYKVYSKLVGGIRKIWKR